MEHELGAASEEQPFKVRNIRKGLYIMPVERDRLNWQVEQLNADTQNDTVRWLLDYAGVPPDAKPSAAWVERHHRPRSRRAGSDTEARVSA